jgi:hypothetical protein
MLVMTLGQGGQAAKESVVVKNEAGISVEVAIREAIEEASGAA